MSTEPPTSTTNRLTVPATTPGLDAPLRTQLHSVLLSTNSISTIHNALLQECQASGWIEALRARSLELMRSGACASFEEVMDVVLREVRGRGQGPGQGLGLGLGRNGVGGGEVVVNGVGVGVGGSGNAEEEKTDVRVPESVVAEGVKIVRAVLEEVLDVPDE